MVVSESPEALRQGPGGILETDPVGTLTPLIREAGIEPESLYYTYTVGCPSPGDRILVDRKGGACRPRLDQLFYLLDPYIVLLVGRGPLMALIGLPGVTRNQGTLYAYHYHFRGQERRVFMTVVMDPAKIKTDQQRADTVGIINWAFRPKTHIQRS